MNGIFNLTGGSFKSTSGTLALKGVTTISGGTFDGSNSTITQSGTLAISGGTYTATSGTLTLTSLSYVVPGSPTFNHNSGTFKFGIVNSTRSITPGSVNYYNVYFYKDSSADAVNNLTGTLYVSGTLTFDDGDGGDTLVGGIIESSGNISLLNTGWEGTTLLKLTGNASGQTITGISGAKLLDLEIATGTNPVTLSGTIEPLRNWKVTSVGTFTTSGSTLRFVNYFDRTISPGTKTYDHVTFYSSGTDTDNTISGTLTMSGNLTLDDADNGDNNLGGTIAIGGNVTILHTGWDGTTTYVMTGNVSGQTVTGGPANSYIPSLEIATGIYPVTLSGNVGVYGDYRATSVGTFTVTGSTFSLYGYNVSHYVRPGTVSYNDVAFKGDCESYDFANQTFKIDGNLSLALAGGCQEGLDNGTLEVKGNITLGANTQLAGSAWIKVMGNSLGQTITGVSTSYMPKLEIAAGTNPVTLSGNVGVYWDYKMTSVGTFTVTSSTLEFWGYNVSHAITPGTANYNNVTFKGSQESYDLGGGTMNVDGNLLMADTGGTGETINNGAFSVKGNVTSSGNGCIGTATITFTGSGNQTLTSAGLGKFITGNVTVNKSGGYVLFASNVNTSTTSWTVTAGTVYLAAKTLTISALSLNSNTVHLKDVPGTSAVGNYKVGGVHNTAPANRLSDFRRGKAMFRVFGCL